MIKVVILEDEIPARKKLKRFLAEVDETIDIVTEIDTVTEAIAFFKTAKPVDLILSDIELLDGNAFEIYKEIKVPCPIIFTTAYNQFLMDAFETNGIEYLLKPFSQERFLKAWHKFLLLSKTNTTDHDFLLKLNQMMGNIITGKESKRRFSVNIQQGFYFIETQDILFFTAEEGVVFAVDHLGKQHLLSETTLKEIENKLDAQEFFRINRSELVNKKYIERVERYSKNSLALKIYGYKKHLVTSQSITSSFREWIEK